MKKNIIKSILITCLSILSLCSCHHNQNGIVILYSTDVHCGVDQSMGYAGIASYKEKMINEGNYCTLVDAGDFIQGDLIGSTEKGKYIIDIMNEAGYEITTLGNHEFDYGMDELSKRIDEFNGDIVSCNISYTGNKENKLNKVKPYVIKEYGNTKVGFVGVTTPTTLTESSPINFIEDSETVYDFKRDDVNRYYSCVQDNVDKCKNDGADYVVLLAHCGYYPFENNPFGSIELLKHTSGYVAILDGHTHLDINIHIHRNKLGKFIPIMDAGTKMHSFGKLTIYEDGSVSTNLISWYNKKANNVKDKVDSIKALIDEEANKVVAYSDLSLSIYNVLGSRIVRKQECPIGNLFADAYRFVGDSQISFYNGGGIRANLKEGELTFKDIKEIQPFENKLARSRIKGQDILDYLEFASMYVPGESGGFAHVSGLKYEINTKIESSVLLDNNGLFIEVSGDYRVQNVKVLENDKYVDLYKDEYYVVAGTDYTLLEGGDGATMFKDSEALETPDRFDYEVIIEYMNDYLHGELKNKYNTTEGRITII